MTAKIYLSGLSEKTSDQDIYTQFSKFGTVLSVSRSRAIDGKKYADNGYVVMGNSAEMNNAIHKLNNSKLDGNTIRVIEAHYMDQDNWHPASKYKMRNNRFRRN